MRSFLCWESAFLISCILHKETIMEYRIEHDSLGEVLVPADHMWGAQTQRSFENFKIGHVMPIEIIRAFAILKKCAAKVNEERGALAPEKGEAI